MPRLDVINETFIGAPPESLLSALCDEHAWSEWFPDLALHCFDDRGGRGKRWTIAGALVGTAEIWLEQIPAGTVVHAFLQADPVRGTSLYGASRARLEKHYAHRLKAQVVAVKDAHDLGRPVGTVSPVLATIEDAAGDGRVAPGEHRMVVREPDQEDHDGQPDDE